MRSAIELQMKLGEIGIRQIEFDLQSRDDIPQLLTGLQYIYCEKNIREQVFKILEEMIPTEIDKKNGRPGMNYWEILVLGTIRLNKNIDYDFLQDLANNHKMIRQMLGHGDQDDNYIYKLQTVKDNVVLLTPEILNKISLLVVKEGHQVILNGLPNIDLNNEIKNEEQESYQSVCENVEQTHNIKNCSEKKDILKGRGDSFVVKTNVHYPTDTNLLFDAVRKIIELTIQLCIILNLPCSIYKDLGIKEIKKSLRLIQKLRRSTSKDEEKKKQRDQAIIDAHLVYIDLANDRINKIKNILGLLCGGNIVPINKFNEIQKFIAHAERQINLIDRRVIKGEIIPHSDKVFSIFEEHTEWLSKGKAGVPFELGLKVCIIEDQHGFILNHEVIQNQTDEKYAVEIIQGTKKIFPNLKVCSFDKGFYTPTNREKLSEELDLVVLPKKGRLSKKDSEIESQEEFVKARRQHSAVESAINALEVHGLDICPDHGIHGFKRYVALAVLARNIQILGCIIRTQQKEALKIQIAA